MKTRSTRSKPSTEEDAATVAESAIPGVSIPEVRRGLDALRTAWNNPESPFYFSAPLSVHAPSLERKRKKVQEQQQPAPATDTMESFCVKYIMGHHVKRYEKAKHQQHS